MPVCRPSSPILKVLVPLAVVLLTGCVTVAPDRQAPLSDGVSDVAASGVRLPGIKPPVPKTAVRPSTATTPVAAATLPPTPPHRPSFPRIDATELAGMTAEQALTAFGTPTRAERRRGDQFGGVTAWIYEADGCRLEIAFYFSVAGNALQAYTHDVAALDRSAELPESLCLHALAKPKPELARRTVAF